MDEEQETHSPPRLPPVRKYWWRDRLPALYCQMGIVFLLFNFLLLLMTRADKEVSFANRAWFLSELLLIVASFRFMAKYNRPRSKATQSLDWGIVVLASVFALIYNVSLFKTGALSADLTGALVFAPQLVGVFFIGISRVLILAPEYSLHKTDDPRHPNTKDPAWMQVVMFSLIAFVCSSFGYLLYEGMKGFAG